MLARAKRSDKNLTEGKLYQVWYEFVHGPSHCVGDDGSHTKSRVLEPIILKPGNRVWLKQDFVGSHHGNRLVKHLSISNTDDYPEVIQHLDDLVVINRNGENVIINENAITGIIEQEKPNRTITISEETYQSIKGQLEKDEQ